MFAQIAAAVVGAGLSYASAKKLQKDQYKDLRDSAQRAGFNPLTVLKAGGGYAAVPHMSKYAAFGQALDGIFDAYKDREEQNKNDVLRDLEIKQRQANIENTIADTKHLGVLVDQSRAANVDPYAGYDKYIPVRVGNNVQQLEIGVAKRLGVEPNGPLIAEDLTAIKGELRGEAEAILANEVADKVLIPAPITGTAGTTQKTPPALASNFDLFVGKMTNLVNSMPNTPVIPPLSDKRWNEEWKNYVN